MKQDIDFVITWVDGTDKEWINKKNKYSNNSSDSSANHYRNFDNLKYWFRGVEKYAPWVHKIYFITDNQIPDWLNTENDKIVIVNHSDYLDKEDLPVFNSNAIELKMHKIPNLSEQFVYFNDDIFLTDYVEKDEFFHKGLPRDSYGETIFIGNSQDTFPHFLLNNMAIINKYFDKHKAYKKINKYFNFKYLKDSFKTFYFLPFKHISCIQNPHIATSYLKSAFDAVWAKESEILTNTCKTKFRTNDNVNIFLFRYWQLLSGKFVPRNNNFGHYYGLSNDNSELISDLKNHTYKITCINDDNLDIDFNKVKKEINDTFDYILTDKSSFER